MILDERLEFGDALVVAGAAGAKVAIGEELFFVINVDPVFYVNRTIREKLRLGILEKTNTQTTSA